MNHDSDTVSSVTAVCEKPHFISFFHFLIKFHADFAFAAEKTSSRSHHSGILFLRMNNYGVYCSASSRKDHQRCDVPIMRHTEEENNSNWIMKTTFWSRLNGKKVISWFHFKFASNSHRDKSLKRKNLHITSCIGFTLQRLLRFGCKRAKRARYSESLNLHKYDWLTAGERNN